MNGDQSMTNVVTLAAPDPIQKLITEIRGHLYDAKGAQAKFDKHRLAAGQKLLALRRRVEAGEVGEGVSWWAWFETADIGRSRKDAEKLMRMASSDDPEAAAIDERDRNREAKREHRERAAEVSGRQESYEEYDIVGHAMNLVAKMSEEQREQFDETYMEKYHG